MSPDERNPKPALEYLTMSFRDSEERWELNNPTHFLDFDALDALDALDAAEDAETAEERVFCCSSCGKTPVDALAGEDVCEACRCRQ